MRTSRDEHDFGDGEDIDHFAILRVFTMSFSVAPRIHFSDFRIEFSIKSLRAWRDYFDMGFLDENETISKTSNVCKGAAGSATHLPN